MDHTPDTDKRLTELEIKASFTEDTLEQLNAVIVRQQAQIDRLVRELVELRNRATAEPGAQVNLRDELPPHY
ncbi:SlyX family protein [Roseateles sp. DC23W]|uniref:SlyX family protein n=1 Tax=Pelomonas dachongensis TaxID=3299029 RepID=A0ABW7EGL6_9BURK